MEGNSIISFIRIARTNPKSLDSKRIFNKTLHRIASDTYEVRKNELRKEIDKQRDEVMECYQKYIDIVRKSVGEDQLQFCDEDKKEELIQKFIDEVLKPKQKEPVLNPVQELHAVDHIDNEENENEQHGAEDSAVDR